MSERESVPSRQVLRDAMEANRHAGHENAGFLSESHGFMPLQPPLQYLPEGFHAWDELAAQLPDLYRTLRLRASFEAMETLDAQRLPDHALLRASALLSLFAHTYYRVESTAPKGLPASLQQPWEIVTRRLGRRAPVLSYIDLIVYNWRLLNPECDDPMRVENMHLLIPTVDNREENLFYLTQVEILARCSPIINAVVCSQEAVYRDDPEALKQNLAFITDCLHRIIHDSLPKIDPNPLSQYYVDPITWSKTVAPLAVPIHEGVQGPSGTSSPIFNLLDEFLGRQTHSSVLGKEILHLRDWYPPYWQEFLRAASKVSVHSYIERKADRELTGVFQETLNAYAGEDGFLGRHRLKVYGYLELAFKVGRNVTIGGFSGLFKDRTWNEVNAALDASRLERHYRSLHGWHRVPVKPLPRESFEGTGNARHIVLDVSGTGIRYQPGDRCCVLPENSPELVEKTLKALRATGDEPILLNSVWQQVMAIREEHQTITLPLRTLIRLGQIRPVQRAIAKRLYHITHSRFLHAIIEARAEDQWELWDLLEHLVATGFEPKMLWRAHPGDPESIVWIVPPQPYRMYSISSAIEPGEEIWAQEIHLTVGELQYATVPTPVSVEGLRRGTASSYLGYVDDAAHTQPCRVMIKMVHPARFTLPTDETRPIVMLAGGTGMGPFRGFLQVRARQSQAGPNWLFLAARTRDNFLYQDELAALSAADRLQVRAAFSRDDTTPRLVTSGNEHSYVFDPGQRQRIDELLLQDENAALIWSLLRSEEEGGQGGYFYVCGQVGFAKTVMTSIKAIVARFSPDTEAERSHIGEQMLARLVAENRFMQEVFTTYSGPAHEQRNQIPASEVILHNNDTNGYWMIINGRVYDLTEFIHLHPGGVKILQGYAGMDATTAYQDVLHHVRPEVDSLLGLYEIGMVRRLDFGSSWAVMVTQQGLEFISLADAYRMWIRLLYLVIEMENALNNDFTIQEGITTAGETPTSRSAYKTALIIEVHRRFLQNYVHGLSGEPLYELWAMFCGFWASKEDTRWMQRTVEEILAGPEAQTVHAATATLTQELHDSTESAQRGEHPILSICQLLEIQDKRFLHEIKMTLRDGLLLFEETEEIVVQQGREQLMTIIKRIPMFLENYFSRLSIELSQHASGIR